MLRNQLLDILSVVAELTRHNTNVDIYYQTAYEHIGNVTREESATQLMSY